jgi:hypothetical protein
MEKARKAAERYNHVVVTEESRWAELLATQESGSKPVRNPCASGNLLVPAQLSAIARRTKDGGIFLGA